MEKLGIALLWGWNAIGLELNKWKTFQAGGGGISK